MLYEAGSVPRRVIFSPRETSQPTLNLSLAAGGQGGMYPPGQHPGMFGLHGFPDGPPPGGVSYERGGGPPVGGMPGGGMMGRGGGGGMGEDQHRMMMQGVGLICKH